METVALSGDLTLATAVQRSEEMAPRLQGPELTLDLAAIGEVDSTAVSLLLHWKRDARAAGRLLIFRNPPASLRSLAALYGVEDVLGLG
ncbi:STAS domain-containing protein [Chitinimonas lacunae]|uniref:Lipid asymmetry maintenance protein MlaB n=1 Tax=Chitinimonas lacunae TaxID=1963018 RepID=A0ABV8MR16_9NEIS